MRLRTRALGIFFLSLLSLPASAHVRTMSETGRPLYWTNPGLAFFANPTNSSGLSDGSVASELSAALQAWSVAGTYVSSSYQQSTSFPGSSAQDGRNTMAFSSAGRGLGYGIVAVTEVTYYLNSGEIVEADITFNDQQFTFTDHPGDTGRTIGGRTAIYLRDVATHEAGHAFGLDHTTVNLSSLVYTAFSGQYSLGGDDKSAITTIYPSTGGRGALTGYIGGRNGGIFGAHVTAIDLRTGKASAGTLAAPDGSFRLGDLAPGPYAVMMEPLGTSSGTISSYYSNVNHRFCGGSRFRRRFYGACGSNQATLVDVQAGAATGLGSLAPSCNAMANPAGAPSTPATALDLPANGGLVYGTLTAGGTHYYRVRGASGQLVARAMAYALYSPLDLTVDVLDENGNALAGAVSVPDVESPMPGGLTNYDSLAEATGTGGTYLIRVRAAVGRLSSSLYPAGFDLLDADGFYLLSLSVDGSFGAAGTVDMSSCMNLNNYAQSANYRAPAATGAPREGDSGGGGGCGSLTGGGPPADSGLLQLLAAVALLHIFLRLRRRKAALVKRRR